MVKSLIIHGNSHDENQHFELESSESYVYNDIFGLVDTQRFKAIIAFDTSLFKPSEHDSWANLYKYIQESAIKDGVTLVIAKSHMHHGNKEYRIICSGGQIKQKRRGGTSNEVQLNNDGYAAFATPLSLRRSKANEKIGSKPCP